MTNGPGWVMACVTHSFSQAMWPGKQGLSRSRSSWARRSRFGFLNAVRHATPIIGPGDGGSGGEPGTNSLGTGCSGGVPLLGYDRGTGCSGSVPLLDYDRGTGCSVSVPLLGYD